MYQDRANEPNRGAWKVGIITSVVVTDKRTDRYDGIEVTDWEKYEKEHYGGYILAESIPSFRDALIVAAGPDLLDACKQIINGLATRDQAEFNNGINAARAAIDKAEPPQLLLTAGATTNRLIAAESLINGLAEKMAVLKVIASDKMSNDTKKSIFEIMQKATNFLTNK